jgi:hypothetical protein
VKPTVLIAAALVAVLGVAAIAFAATGGDGGGNSNQAAAPSATPEPPTVAAPTATEVPPTPTPIPPTEAPTLPATPGPDTPVTSDPTPGPQTPIPSEPPFTVTPAPTQAGLPAGRYAEAAPIDGLDVRVAESFPPQYFLHIQAGLPSGCAEQYTHSFTRDGNVIEVEVLNSFPEGSPVCTAIYGMYEVNIALGSDFVSGQTYTINVNDGAAETEFVAQ